MDSYPGCIVPPLPDKSLKDKFEHDNSQFVDDRKQGLIKFLDRVARHRVLGRSDEFMEFIRNDKFYHSERGSPVAKVQKQFKQLWTQGKSWTQHLGLLTSKSANASATSDRLKLDQRVESDFSREVVIGADLLEGRLLNLKTSLEKQVATVVKNTQAYQRLRHLLYKDPHQTSPEEEAQAVDCSTFDGSQPQTQKAPAEETESDLLKAFSLRTTSLCSAYQDGLLADVSFYHRYIVSLKASIASRQVKIDNLLNQQKTRTLSLLEIDAKAASLSDQARSLLCEFQELSSEIEVRLVDNIASLALKYACD